MKIELYNNEFVRIGQINKYSYVSKEFCESSYGNILIKCELDEKVLSIISQVQYILLDNTYMAVLEYYNADDINSSNEITLKGQHVKSILSYRVLFPQFSSTGTYKALAKQLVEKTFKDKGDPDRYVEMIEIEEFEEDENAETTTLQVTGSDVGSEVMKLAEAGKFIIDMVPKLVAYNQETGKLTNVDKMVYKIFDKKDRSIGNKEGNSPVVFSYSLSNLESASYVEDASLYKNIILVAGEGEKSQRKIRYVTDESKLFVPDEHTMRLIHFTEKDKTETLPSLATYTMTNMVASNEHSKFPATLYHMMHGKPSYVNFTNPLWTVNDDLTIEWWEYRVESPTTSPTASHPLYASDQSADNNGNPYNRGFFLMCDQTTGADIYLKSLYSRCLAGTTNLCATANLIPEEEQGQGSEILNGTKRTGWIRTGDKIYNKWVHRATTFDWIQDENGKYHAHFVFYQNGQKYYEYMETTARAAKLVITRTTNGYIHARNGIGGNYEMYLQEFRISNIIRYKGDSFELPQAPFSAIEEKVYNIKKGLARREAFVDARDVQSTSDAGTVLTGEEYKKALILRGLEKLQDYVIIKTIDATVSTLTGKKYIYGVDYREGDIVTVQLEPIGVSVNVPITKVTVTEQGGITYHDITLGEVRDVLKKKLKKEGLL